jgi:5,10-methenyltetrahydromethanopterin hydrogenase
MFDALEASDPLVKDLSQRKNQLNYYLPALLMLAVIAMNAALMLITLAAMMVYRGERVGRRRKGGKV